MLYSSYTISMFYKKKKRRKFLLHTQPVLSYPWVYICEHKNIGKNQILVERGIKANKNHWGSFFFIYFFDQKVLGLMSIWNFSETTFFFGVYLECRKVVEQKINKIVLDCDGLFISVPTRVWSQYCLYNIYKTF